MAQSPSLSEFTNIQPEATVNPGVILDSRDAVHELNQSAQFNAEMKQRRYSQQLEATSKLYQDLGAIQETPVLQQDRPLLYNKMADIFKIIGEDPHAALGGPKFNQIEQELGQLRTLANASKQDNIYAIAHEKLLDEDPSLATPENKDKVNQFANGRPGQRQKFLFDTPVKFDPEAAMGKILQQKQVAVPFADVGFSGPHNEYMTRTAGTAYKRDAALNIWNQGYETGTDENNQPIKKWAQEQFQKIQGDPGQMQKFGNPKNPQELYQNIGAMMYGSKSDIVGEKTATQTANPYALLNNRQNFSLYMEGIKEGNREKLAAVRENLKLQGAPENANFLLRQYAGILGNVTGQKNAVEVSKGKFENEDVVDVPANILKTYAESRKQTIREGHGSDPVAETIVEGNTPDLVTRTADGNLRLTFYKRYDKADKRPKGKQPGDLVTDANGNPVLQTTGIIPRRNLLATLGKGVVETKILSYSIDEADKALRGQPNSVIDKINTDDPDAPAIQQARQVQATPKKSYTFKGKTYTTEQVEKAAKQSGLSVDEYIKQAGLK